MMACDRFRKLDPCVDPSGPDGEAWREHLDGCRECGDWYMARRVRNAGHDPARYPCIHLAYYSVGVCPEHTDPFECPDIAILVNLERNRFGIPIRDGGTGSYHMIRYCPWCGIRLPDENRIPDAEHEVP